MVLGGIRDEDIEQAVDIATALHGSREADFLADDYVDTNVSEKIVKIIQSYTKIVNNTVWRKSN